MYEVTVKAHFAAAHFLKGYNGKCENMHGHNWKVSAVVTNDILDEMGMVADFRYLKEHLNVVLDQLDHQCLNDLEYFKTHNPTTENVAKYIYQEFKKEITPLRLKHIEVFESDTAGVVYYE